MPDRPFEGETSWPDARGRRVVFLLDTAAFADDLPSERRQDLKAFTAYLEQRQREAHGVAGTNRDVSLGRRQRLPHRVVEGDWHRQSIAAYVDASA